MKRKIDMAKRRLAGEVLIHVYRLQRDVVLFSLNDRVLRWYGAGLTPKERQLVAVVSQDVDLQNRRLQALYMRMIPREGK